MNHEPTTIQCKVNKVLISFQVDTGSHISTLNICDLKLIKGVTVRPTQIKARSYSGDIIHFLGEADVNLCYNDVCVKHKFLIVNSQSVSLLGRDLCSKLNINLTAPCNNDNVAIHSVHNSILNDFKHYLSDNFKSNVKETVSLHLENCTKEVFCKARSVPLHLRGLVEEELERLKRNGTISEVFQSKWASPTVNVLKSENAVRICGDYSCTVNQFLNLAHYPLPSIDEVISQIGSAKVFSKLDLANAFLQLPLDSKSKEYTTINTSEGLYRYNYLPFGLCSSPGIFQSFMCKVLNGIDNIIIYQDDILILTSTIEEHNAVLRRVLEVLQKTGIKLDNS